MTLREQLESGVGVLAASFDNGKNTMLAVVTDDLRDRGIRADTILREIAAAAGGKGGGKPHMAQAGIPDAARMASALSDAPEIIRKHLRCVRVSPGNPPPPMELEAAMLSALNNNPSPTATEVLDAAERLLDKVLRTDCETRSSALDLLTVDALMTRALEIATQDPKLLDEFPEEAMRQIGWHSGARA